jgi:hypothetical protein
MAAPILSRHGSSSRSESPQSALHVEMCMAQHLSLSAQTSHSSRTQLPQCSFTRPAIHASRSVLIDKTSVCGLYGPCSLLIEGLVLTVRDINWIRGHQRATPYCCDAAGGAAPNATERAERVKQALSQSGVTTMCLGTTKSGAPRHPLYIRRGTPLVPLHNG